MAERLVEAPLELSIHGNGCGFDSREAQLGEGVRNMRTRANRIGAQLAIYSQRATRAWCCASARRPKERAWNGA